MKYTGGIHDGNPFAVEDTIFPLANSQFGLGIASRRWLTVYTTNLDATGTVTVPTPVNNTDAAPKLYVDDRLAILTVEEVDGSPSLTNTSTFRFDQADGFVVSNPSTGIVRIDLSAIPYSVIQDVSATDRLLGRSTAGAGDIEEITCTAAGRAILDDATAAAQRTTLGSTTIGDALFITASAAAARSSIGAVIGTDVQAFDADLDALAALAATAGMVSRTGAGAFAVRTVTGTASNISVADGTGASANPTIDLVNTGPGATGPIGSATVAPVVTIDAKGRVTALTSATISAGLSAATQAQMEAASSDAVAATPGTTQYHPGVVKLRGTWSVAGTLDSDYGIDTITDSGPGDWTVNHSVAFSGAIQNTSTACAEGTTAIHATIRTRLTTTTVVNSWNSSGTQTDPSNAINFMAAGDQ